MTPLAAKATAADQGATTPSNASLAETTDLIRYQKRRRRTARGDQDKDKLGFPAWPSTMASQGTMVSPGAASTRLGRRNTTRRTPYGDTAYFTIKAERSNSPCL